MNPNNLGGMHVRTGPGTGHSPVARDNAFNNDHVAVFAMGVPPDDGGGGEWWLVMTPGGSTGYARGIDAQGVHNFRLLSNPQPNVQIPPIDGGGAAPLPAPTPDDNGGGDFDQGGIDTRGAAAGVAGMPATVGRYPYRPFGMQYDTVNARRRAVPRGYARIGAGPATVASPAGTFLRPAPNAAGLALLPPGSVVHVDEHLPAAKRETTSPGLGGWARVRCHRPGFPPLSGYMLSEWLVPGYAGPAGGPALIGRANVAPWARRS